MKLTAGQLFWPTQSDARVFGPPESDLECDVLVVGAGVTGALIADALAQSGRDVVVIDKREPGCGSTGASTSLLLYELDTPLIELTKLIGATNAARVYQMGVSAIQKLADIVSSLDDSCGFQWRKSVYLCSNEKDLPDLRSEYQARKRAGLRVDLLEAVDVRSLFGFSRPGAIVSHDAAEIDPYRLTQKLLERAVGRGLRLFSRCELSRASAGEGKVVATVSTGHCISAKRVVYATGYEAASMFDGNLAERQVTYAAVSQPLESFPGWWERSLIWETDRPYLYLRTTPDNRAMIGGLDDQNHNLLNDMGHIDRKAHELAREFGKLFPKIPFEIDAAWAGVFETTGDGMPYIGPHPQFPNSFFALGYGGNGLTFSVIASQILEGFCTERVLRESELFRFSRPSR